MKVLHNSKLIITVKYLSDNNGSPTYQRGIPRDLQNRFGKKLIRLCLDANNRNFSIAQQIQRFARSHDALFQALKDNPTLQVSETKLSALTLLDNFNLSQGDAEEYFKAMNDEAFDEGIMGNIAVFYEHFNALKETGQLTNIEIAAEKALRQPLPLLLSEAIDIYFKNHARGRDEKFCNKVLMRWKKFIEVVGDIPLISLNRNIGRKYRDARLSQTFGIKVKKPVKTTTVEREINDIRAIINKVTREEGINIRNPFEALEIQGLNQDSEAREPFDQQELSHILDKCVADFDEIRCLMILQVCTGARISEIAGLRRQDVAEHEGITYIRIRKYGQRTLKTKESSRDVPLVDFANKVLQRYISILDCKSSTLFPRYADGVKVNGDTVSASVNKYIRSLGIDKTSHSFRHTMRDLLRGANVAIDIAHEIGGWGSQSIGESYGKGYGLGVKLDALQAALKPIKLPDIKPEVDNLENLTSGQLNNIDDNLPQTNGQKATIIKIPKPVVRFIK